MRDAERCYKKPSYLGPVDFMPHFASSPQFQVVFQEGMSLVEETANYLDGPGRVDVQTLEKPGIMAYATESMHLTTRLMQLASWLLLQRAVSQGELTDYAAWDEKKKINLHEVGGERHSSILRELPRTLRELVERSLTLHQRILKLDLMIAERFEDHASLNPVADQVNLIERAFLARRQG